MNFLSLALKSLWNRRLTTLLTVFSIALSTGLLLSVERIKRAAEEGFTQSISQTDLIVGGRTGAINLILYTVFNIGNATNNVSIESYEHFKKMDVVDWTIPYSLGDGHRGFRVVGTDENLFQYYHFRGDETLQFQEGKKFDGIWDVVLGSEVARQLQYKLGQSIVVAHGVTRDEGIIKHEDKPFHVVGILKSTGTALDRSLYISLEGMEALHVDWQGGAMPTKDQVIPQEQIKKENLKPKTITAFFLRTKSRIETLKLQRDINTYTDEPLLAIIPGVTLSELWRGLSYIEQTLKIISWMVIGVGLVAMLIALLTSLNERRREMAILRSLGAGLSHILALVVFESGFLTVAGLVFGSFVQWLVFLILSPWLSKEFGIVLSGQAWTMTEVVYLSATLLAGVLIGVIPAFRAQQMALKDGLSLRI